MALFFFKIFFFDKEKSICFFLWIAFNISINSKRYGKKFNLFFSKIIKKLKIYIHPEKNFIERGVTFNSFIWIQKLEKSYFLAYDFLILYDIFYVAIERNRLVINSDMDLEKSKNIHWLKKSILFWGGKKFLFPILHQKDFLFNDIISFFFREEDNFFSGKIKFKNQSLFNIISESLWILDSQYNKFWERRKHGGKISLPSSFLIKIFGSKIYIEIWCEAKKKEKKNKILKEINLRKISILIKIVFKLYYQFIFPIWDENIWIDAFLKLPETFVSYANYNKKCLFRTEKNHSRKVFRDYKKFMEIETIEIKDNKYSFLKNLEIKPFFDTNFKKIGNYFSFNLSPFLPEDKHERAKVLEKINLSFPIELLKYFPGGNKRKIIYCWKIPMNKNQRSILKKNTLINKEVLNFPIFFSRAMLKKSKKKEKGGNF
jgi:hypothetical protein